MKNPHVKVFFVLLLFAVCLGCFADRPYRHHRRSGRGRGTERYSPPPAERPDRAVLEDKNLVRDRFRGSAGELQYCRFAENMDMEGAPLLVLILHGRTGSGSDNKQQLATPAVKPFLDYVRKHRIKAVLLLPQCPPRHGWVDDDMMKLVMEFYDAKCREYRVPPAKSLLTGFSMGGGGCYPLAANYPGRFAKILVVSAGGLPEMAAQIRGDFYIANGEEDSVIPAANAEKMAAALRDNGCKVQLEILPGKGHVDGGRAAYKGRAREWFFSAVGN